MVQFQIVIVDIATAVNVLFHLANRQRAKVTRFGGQCVNDVVGQRVNVFLNVVPKVFQALQVVYCHANVVVRYFLVQGHVDGMWNVVVRHFLVQVLS